MQTFIEETLLPARTRLRSMCHFPLLAPLFRAARRETGTRKRVHGGGGGRLRLAGSPAVPPWRGYFRPPPPPPDESEGERTAKCGILTRAARYLRARYGSELQCSRNSAEKSKRVCGSLSPVCNTGKHTSHPYKRMRTVILFLELQI